MPKLFGDRDQIPDFPKGTSLPKHFWNRVNFNGSGGCWLWTGGLIPKGYALYFVNGKSRTIHRVVFEDLVGPIPPQKTIDHLCRVRNCCNPSHLRIASFRENALCGIGPTAVNSQKEECLRGHSLSGSNLILRRRKSGGSLVPESISVVRECRACGRDRTRAYMKRKRAENVR